MKTFAQLAAAFLATVDACALGGFDTPATFDCETAGDVCSYVEILTVQADQTNVEVADPVVYCAAADADEATIESAVQAVKLEALTWTTPITFDQAVANVLDRTDPACTEEDATCMLEE